MRNETFCAESKTMEVPTRPKAAKDSRFFSAAKLPAISTKTATCISKTPRCLHVCGMRNRQAQRTLKNKRSAIVFNAGNGKNPPAKRNQLPKKRSAPSSRPPRAQKSVPQKTSAKRAKSKTTPNRSEPKERQIRKNFVTSQI